MRFLALFIICVFLLDGCGSTGIRQDSTVNQANLAQQLMQQGQYAQAADKYLQLAQAYPQQRNFYHLQAVRAYLEDHDIQAADSLIAGIEPAQEEELLFEKIILQARLDLMHNRAEQALARLDISLPDTLSTPLFVRYYQVKGDALIIHRRYLDAAELYARQIQLLTDKKQKDKITATIWDTLNMLSLDDLQRAQTGKYSDLRSWIELVTLNKSLATRPQQLATALQGWLRRYPGHPANPLITSRLMDSGDSFRPTRIALLLPLSGAYEKYAERIRDGFLAAWFMETDYKPEVVIYDTDSINIREIYQKAVSEGADFVVGPLEKNAVKIVYEMAPLPVRTLALNQIDPTDMTHHTDVILADRPELVQFGLLPEDEALEIVRRGIADGYKRALVITPADELGARIYNTFRLEWESQGGVVLERVSYDPRTRDFSPPVKDLLNINSSESRINTLQQRLSRNIIGASRVREDADFILLVANTLAARQIVPQFLFFGVGHIPVFSTSHAYTGRPNPQIDSDLNGIEFVDIPWVIRPVAQAPAIQQKIEQYWKESGVFPRYYAFGVDAFRVIPLLETLANNPAYRYSGQTGNLYLEGNGTIHRKLLWARIVNGNVEPLNRVSSP